MYSVRTVPPPQQPQPLQQQTTVYGHFDAGARFAPGKPVNIPVSERNSI